MRHARSMAVHHRGRHCTAGEGVRRLSTTRCGCRPGAVVRCLDEFLFTRPSGTLHSCGYVMWVHTRIEHKPAHGSRGVRATESLAPILSPCIPERPLVLLEM